MEPALAVDSLLAYDVSSLRESTQDRHLVGTRWMAEIYGALPYITSRHHA